MQYFTPKLTIASRRKWFMWPTRGQPVLPQTLGRPFLVYFLLRFHTWNYTLPRPLRDPCATIIHLGWHGVGKPAKSKNCIAEKSSFKLVEFNREKKIKCWYPGQPEQSNNHVISVIFQVVHNTQLDNELLRKC